MITFFAIGYVPFLNTGQRGFLHFLNNVLLFILASLGFILGFAIEFLYFFITVLFIPISLVSILYFSTITFLYYPALLVDYISVIINLFLIFICFSSIIIGLINLFLIILILFKKVYKGIILLIFSYFLVFLYDPVGDLILFINLYILFFCFLILILNLVFNISLKALFSPLEPERKRVPVTIPTRYGFCITEYVYAIAPPIGLILARIFLAFFMFIATLISNILTDFILYILYLFLINFAYTFTILILVLYINNFNEIHTFISQNLTILIHSSYFIVRFAFLLIYSVIFIPFLIYNFYFLILYFLGLYFPFKLANYYDSLTSVESEEGPDSYKEWWDSLNWYSKFDMILYNLNWDLEHYTVIDIINYLALKLIDLLEFIYNYLYGINNTPEPNDYLFDISYNKLEILVLCVVKLLGCSALVQFIIEFVWIVYDLTITRWIFYWLEYICLFLYNFPWNFYLTLRKTVEGCMLTGDGFVIYGFTPYTVEDDFEPTPTSTPTPVEPLYTSNEDVKHNNNKALYSRCLSNFHKLENSKVTNSSTGNTSLNTSSASTSSTASISSTANTSLTGNTSLNSSTANISSTGNTSTATTSSTATISSTVNPICNRSGPISQVRHFSSSPRVLSNSNLHVTTTTKNNWTIINYGINSASIILSAELFKPLVQEFVSNLSPDNTAFMVKVEYHDGSTRSLMSMQIINSSFGFDEVISLIEFHLNLKAEWYKSNAVYSVILIYKPTHDIVRLTRPLDMTDSSSDSIKDLQYLPFIPHSYDLDTWGNRVKSYRSTINIESFDNLFKYSVTVSPDYYIVIVYTKVTTKSSKYTSYKHLAEFTMVSLDSSNLTHVEVILTLHNMEYTFEINKGSLVKGEIPYNLNFMTRLYPLEKGKSWNSNNILTFDLETRTINNELTPYAIGFYDGESSNSFYLSDFNSVDDMMLTALSSIIVERYNGWYIYAHNLSGFDAVFIIKYLAQLAHNNELHPIMRAGKLISLDFDFELAVEYQSKPLHATLHFLDSINLMDSSLRKLGKSFNVSVQKDIFPYRFSDIAPLDYIGEVPAQSYFDGLSLSDYQSYVQRFDNCWSMREVCLQYMIDDCVSLYQIIQSFGNLICKEYRVDITITPTTPSLAMRIYRTCFMNTPNIALIDGQLYNVLKKAYYGGIVDAFIPYGENLAYNDVNSLYPYGIKFNIPVGNPVHVIGNIDLNNFFGVVKAHIVCPENLQVPLLPVQQNGHLIAATGEWTGWYISEELRDVRDNSGYTVTPIEGYRFDQETIFPEYVDHFYDLKVLAKGDKKLGIKPDPARYLMCKLILNSLYGRFGMSTVMENTLITPSSNSFGTNIVTDVSILSEGVDILTSQSIGHNLNINVAVAAFVTAYSRIHMNQIKRLEGYQIYYTDTDSLVTNKALPIEIYGPALGQMKLEHHVIKGLFLGPKMYALITPEETIMKIRGLRAKDIKFGFNEILSLLTGNIITSQTLMFRDISQGIITVREQLFTLMATDTKRVIIRDSLGKFVSTKPYRLLNGVLTSSIRVNTSTALVIYESRNLSLTCIPQSQVMSSSSDFNIMIYHLHNIRYIEFIIYSNPSMISILNRSQNFILFPNYALVVYIPQFMSLVIYNPQPINLVYYYPKILSLVVYIPQFISLVIYIPQFMSLVIYIPQFMSLGIYIPQFMSLVIYTRQFMSLLIYYPKIISLVIYPLSLYLSENLTSSIFNDILRFTYLSRLRIYILELDDRVLILVWLIFCFQLIFYIIYKD